MDGQKKIGEPQQDMFWKEEHIQNMQKGALCCLLIASMTVECLHKRSKQVSGRSMGVRIECTKGMLLPMLVRYKKKKGVGTDHINCQF